MSRRVPLVIVLAALGGYGIFTGALFSSGSGDDGKAGLLFLVNVPVLLGWLAVTARRARRGFVLGFVAAGVQFVIMGAMFALDIGDWAPVVTINSVIATLMGLAALACWWRGSAGAKPDDAETTVEHDAQS